MKGHEKAIYFIFLLKIDRYYLKSILGGRDASSANNPLPYLFGLRENQYFHYKIDRLCVSRKRRRSLSTDGYGWHTSRTTAKELRKNKLSIENN